MRYFAFGSNMGTEQMKERGVRFSKRLGAVLDGVADGIQQAGRQEPA